MPIINEIDAALARPATYEEKVALFAKYSGNAAMIRTFKLKRDRKTRESLDYQLRRLRWKPGIALVKKATAKPITEKIAQPIPPTKNSPPKTNNSLYPPIIEAAIQDRQKAVNQREKAGRELTEKADLLSQEERAAFVQTQKEQHKIVMATTAVINTWKQSGILPEEKAEETKPSIPPEQLADYEAEWKEKLRALSRSKKNLKNWEGKGNPKKLAYHQATFDQLDERLDQLAAVLGKKRKK